MFITSPINWGNIDYFQFVPEVIEWDCHELAVNVVIASERASWSKVIGGHSSFTVELRFSLESCSHWNNRWLNLIMNLVTCCHIVDVCRYWLGAALIHTCTQVKLLKSSYHPVMHLSQIKQHKLVCHGTLSHNIKVYSVSFFSQYLSGMQKHCLNMSQYET